MIVSNCYVNYQLFSELQFSVTIFEPRKLRHGDKPNNLDVYKLSPQQKVYFVKLITEACEKNPALDKKYLLQNINLFTKLSWIGKPKLKWYHTATKGWKAANVNK